MKSNKNKVDKTSIKKKRYLLYENKIKMFTQKKNIKINT